MIRPLSVEDEFAITHDQWALLRLLGVERVSRGTHALIFDLENGEKHARLVLADGRIRQAVDVELRVLLTGRP